jgi:hypothetical protein
MQVLTWARRPEILGHPILPAADVPHLRFSQSSLPLWVLSLQGRSRRRKRKERRKPRRAQNKA